MSKVSLREKIETCVDNAKTKEGADACREAEQFKKVYSIDQCGSAHWVENTYKAQIGYGAVDIYEIPKSLWEKEKEEEKLPDTFEFFHEKVKDNYRPKKTKWLSEEESEAIEEGRIESLDFVEPNQLVVFE